MNILAKLLIFVAIPLLAQTPSAVSVFETSCLPCHAGKLKKSGLDLSSRESLLKGGEHGPAIVPGNAKASLLYKVVSHEQAPHMPFGMAKLPADAIAAISDWIDKGAPFSQPIQASTHWSFRQPVRPPTPGLKYSNPIDAFLAVERDKRSLTPVPEAGRRTLLRRASLDLIGIPPTPQQLQEFLADKSSNAYEKAVDRLLDDPRYGERWARHWMDVWRYSDWYGWRKGKDVRNSSRYMWRWRDWIVESLNADKGYDRMIVEMLAGDELASSDPQTLRATGYLARSFSKYDRHGWMQDAVDHTAMGFLGITLKCARCHDHKYDPFTQEEYFQFRAFFEPYQVRTDRVPGQPDTEKDGLARAYDAEPNAETFLLIRGDIQNPDKDRRIAPGVPAASRSIRSRSVSMPTIPTSATSSTPT